jgi:hypothetical protein
MPKAPRKTQGSCSRSGCSDPQAEKVYAWEDSWREWETGYLTLPACREIVDVACRSRGILMPTVRQHTYPPESFSIVDQKLISLNRHTGKNFATVLHEVAHYIVWNTGQVRAQDHGPTFLRLYFSLLEAARVAPREALYASARAAGLRWRKGS